MTKAHLKEKKEPAKQNKTKQKECFQVSKFENRSHELLRCQMK